MSQDETERAMAIGHENQEMIVLGKSWCTNIRTVRTHLGVVMLDLGSRSDLRPSWLQSLHNWRPGRVVELEEETELGVERV